MTHGGTNNHHLYLALCNSLAEQDKEFNHWYDAHHLREVVRFLPGFFAARRYRVGPESATGVAPHWAYLALYLVDTTDMVAVHDALPMVAHNFTRATGLDPNHRAWVYSWAGDGDAPSPDRILASGFALHLSNTVPAGDQRSYRLNPHQRPGQEAPPWEYLALSLAGDPAPGDALWHFTAIGDRIP